MKGWLAVVSWRPGWEGREWFGEQKFNREKVKPRRE
jgi:hypothetical protein